MTGAEPEKEVPVSSLPSASINAPCGLMVGTSSWAETMTAAKRMVGSRIASLFMFDILFFQNAKVNKKVGSAHFFMFF